MKEIFLKKSFNFISSHKQLDHYNEVKIKYGLEVMYHFFTKVTGILLISFIFKIYSQNLIIFIFYGPLRIFCHGLHAKSNIACWISSIFTYIFLGFYAKFMYMSSGAFVLSYIILLISIIFFSPADTPKRPIISKNDRLRLKLLALFVLHCELIIGILFASLRIYIFVSMLLQSVLVNPISYKLSKTPRCNYKLICVNQN